MCNTFVERYALFLSSPVFQKVGTRKSAIAFDFYVRNNEQGPIEATIFGMLN